MFDLESIVATLQHLPVWGILLFTCFITFLENIFPPSPSDVVLVCCGALVGLGAVGFVPVTIFATVGSALGFAAMFWIGKLFGEKIVDSGKIKFIKKDTIAIAESWFEKHGYFIIIANRFLSGIRAIISFFAGMSHLNFQTSFWLSAVSALVWNSVLIGAGWYLGDNWRSIDRWMGMYGTAICVGLGGATLLWLIWYIYKKYSKKASE